MEEKQLLYRIWLNDCCDHDPKQVYRLLKEVGTPEEIFQTDFHKLPYSKLFRMGQRLRLHHNLDKAKRFLEDCREKEIQLISMDDENYPHGLLEVFAPPQILYAKGKIPQFNQMFGVAVVGTRKGTKEGLSFSKKLGYDLANNGAVIVSGMALGMDAASQWGALEAGGTTVAVLAGGVDVIYPRENADLYQHILTHGCILSEQPPGMEGKRYFYQQRNRIMVGLSHAVAIVEGEEKSGTAITTRLALESNVDVFAVPGNPLNPYSVIPNQLLRDGCTPLTDALDIIEEYIQRYPEKMDYGISMKGKPIVGIPHPEQIKQKVDTGKVSTAAVSEKSQESFEDWLKGREFSKEEETILRFLKDAMDTVTYDDIADACKMDAGLLSSQLIILQMKKAVSQSAGGQYKIEIGG